MHYDFTIAFAQGTSWSSDGGFHIDPKPEGGIDWLRMANGGLRLNTPAEVRDLYAGRPLPVIIPLNDSMAIASDRRG